MNEQLLSLIKITQIRKEARKWKRTGSGLKALLRARVVHGLFERKPKTESTIGLIYEGQDYRVNMDMSDLCIAAACPLTPL